MSVWIRRKLAVVFYPIVLKPQLPLCFWSDEEATMNCANESCVKIYWRICASISLFL